MKNQCEVALPELVPVTVLQKYGFGRVSCYDQVSKMPQDIVVKFGRRVFLKAGPLQQWLEAGGTRAS